jgi:hypothetical protein
VSSTGGTDLSRLLAELAPVLADGEFVFVKIASGHLPTGIQPRGTFHEDEGMTIICSREEAAAAGLTGSGPQRLITLSVHSALDAVGLLAVVSAALAANGIPCNVVSAMFHDHVFVPAPLAERALAVLKTLSAQHR